MRGQVLIFALAVASAWTVQPTLSERIWSIAIGHDWAGHEYFDATGYLNGFGIQFINLVCDTGRLDCRIVWDSYLHCWDSGSDGVSPSGGVGLMSAWYDACTGWLVTPDKLAVFSFSLPYLELQPTYFYALKGKKQAGIPNDLTGKTIGFLRGWSNNQQCVARQDSITGAILKPDQIFQVILTEEAVQALQDGKVAAIFGSDDYWTTEQANMLEKYTQPFTCGVSGNSMMSRKDSNFPTVWNAAFNKLKENNKFAKFCEETNKEHAHKGTVPCV